tara:strand:+ start:591 stop:746 length:156 start_codon:yes stop_codon:yes gene_type:complete
MKKVYIVYSEKGNIGKSIEVFNEEEDAARYASMNGLQVIEKSLWKDLMEYK